jgi:spermidine synthase
MLLVLLFHPSPQSCLLLGLGSGALVHSLLNQLPDTRLQVVELRKLVIRLARSHFALPRNKRLQIKCADAGDFVAMQSEQTYSLIFSDIYRSDGMDEQQGEVRFLAQCRGLLSPDGWLVLNFWVSHQRLAGISFIKSKFKQVWVNNIDGENWIVMASNSTEHFSKVQLQTRLRTLSEELGLPLQVEFQDLTRKV